MRQNPLLTPAALHYNKPCESLGTNQSGAHMASLSMTGTGSADHIAELLAYEVQNSGLSCELVDSIYRSSAETRGSM